MNTITLLILTSVSLGVADERALQAVEAVSVEQAPTPGQVVAASTLARLSDETVQAGDPVRARVNVHVKFSSIQSVCFDFTFSDDLLDPGEILLIWSDGPGFEDIGAMPESQRTLCLLPQYHPLMVALFLDGKEDLDLTVTGSVKIAALEVTVVGVPRH